ncbi:MAG: transposase [Candidatus Omnitrophica bacterium]|nr:transposase [Candidatus Omnitrophota bacterium]
MKALAILDPRAAFVDVGSERMHVSIAGDTPAVFGTVTTQLHALRDWLLSHGVHAVAMEATGVYWMPLYGVLEEAGLEVSMVNGKQIKNLPGRKTDMIDCQWSLARSKNIALGAFYRRLSARRGGLVANIALARNLAELFWRVMVHGLDYVEEGLVRYEEKVLRTKQQSLVRLARQLGRELIPTPDEIAATS